jgi:hypothetical protein
VHSLHSSIEDELLELGEDYISHHVSSDCFEIFPTKGFSNFATERLALLKIILINDPLYWLPIGWCGRRSLTFTGVVVLDYRLVGADFFGHDLEYSFTYGYQRGATK